MREVGIRHNSEVELFVKDRCLVLVRIAPSYTLDELVAGISPSSLHEETDWGPAIGNEVW